MARTEDAWWTPAHMAASMGRSDCLRMLLDEGVDINAGAGSHRSSTLLHEASHGGHKDIVQLLLDEGKNNYIYFISYFKVMRHDSSFVQNLFIFYFP